MAEKIQASSDPVLTKASWVLRLAVAGASLGHVLGLLDGAYKTFGRRTDLGFLGFLRSKGLFDYSTTPLF